ncbi:MAG: glutathione S-transferase N-terminal domain-containing protein [Pseudomonadota bacterium]
MSRILYDLAMADEDIRPSPFCWLAKFALLHKELAFETQPLRLAEKEKYPDPEHGRVPMLQDGDELICDSRKIIAYLDAEYRDKPLAATKGEYAAADFLSGWVTLALFPALGPMIIPHVFLASHPDDHEYFRSSREERIGMTLEEYGATPNAKSMAETALKMLALPLTRRKFLGGDNPNLCDYTAFAPFIWQRVVIGEGPYETPQPVGAWQERMLDLFDGYARKAKTVA